MMTKNKRLYDNSQWTKSRLAYLSQYPLCVECAHMGRVTPSYIVDHVTPHKGDVGLFWDRDNWQALCKHCHDSYKKTFEMSGKDKGSYVDGQPMGRNHHWNG